MHLRVFYALKTYIHDTYLLTYNVLYVYSTREQMWGLKVPGGNENVKSVFRAYIRQKWIDLRQIKTKMITGPFYIYRRIHFNSRYALFLLYLSEIVWDGRMSQRPPRYAPTCIYLTFWRQCWSSEV